MKLNRELSQQSWQEVKHFVLDDSFGCEEPYLVLSTLTPTSGALRDYNRALVLEHPRINFHFYFHFNFRNFSPFLYNVFIYEIIICHVRNAWFLGQRYSIFPNLQRNSAPKCSQLPVKRQERPMQNAEPLVWFVGMIWSISSKPYI